MDDLARHSETSPAFLQKLRDATSSRHTALEALPLSKMLMRDDVTLENYALYLRCMKDVIAVYDSEVLPLVDEILPQKPSGERLSSLAADMAYVVQHGVSVDNTEPLHYPEIPSKAFALGMAYVIEGSTLGGRVILKHLSSRINVTERQGAAFFAGYGRETGARWRQFLEALTTFVTDSDREFGVIAGAVAGFDMISVHFSKHSYKLIEIS